MPAPRFNGNSQTATETMPQTMLPTSSEANPITVCYAVVHHIASHLAYLVCRHKGFDCREFAPALLESDGEVQLVGVQLRQLVELIPVPLDAPHDTENLNLESQR